MLLCPSEVLALNALHLVAAARGVATSDVGCLCAFCGDSPFPPTEDLSKTAPAVLATQADARATVICAGCRDVTAGKPGSDPPPLRTRNIALVDGVLSHPPLGEMRAYVSEPPAGPAVFSWATSRQKHHLLHAGVSDRRRQVWGSDSGPIEILPQVHEPVLLSIESLLAWHRRSDIENGTYSAPSIQKHGASRWSELEAAVAGFRGQRAWPLLVAMARKPEAPEPREELWGPLFGGGKEEVRDPIDELAVDMLEGISRTSERRGEDGIGFWGGYLRSRIQRHAHRPLRECMSRLLDECGTSATSEGAAEMLSRLEAIPEAQAREVSQALRSRTALLVAMTFDRLRKDGTRTKMGATA